MSVGPNINCSKKKTLCWYNVHNCLCHEQEENKNLLPKKNNRQDCQSSTEKKNHQNQACNELEAAGVHISKIIHYFPLM